LERLAMLKLAPLKQARPEGLRSALRASGECPGHGFSLRLAYGIASFKTKVAWLPSLRKQSQRRFRRHVRSATLKGFLRCAQTTDSLSPALRLHGEFLLPDDAKETKRSDAHEAAGLRPVLCDVQSKRNGLA
jgi:hypothetical protein